MAGTSDEAAAEATAQYLEELRTRVARQADAAARLRAGLPLEPEPVAEPAEPEVAAPPVEPPPVLQPAPQAPAPPRLAAVAPLRLSLWSLERLARARAAEDPTRAAELRWTLLYLRSHADARGDLPDCFAELADSVFGTFVHPESARRSSA
jgi:hypothetical protein